MSFRILARVALIGALVIGIVLWQSPLLSQAPEGEQQTEQTEDAPAEGAEGVAPAQDNQALQLDSHWYKDPAIWVIGILGLLVVAVAIDRAYVIYKKNKGDNAALVQYLTESLLNNNRNVSAIAAEAAQERYGLEGRIAAIALKGWDFGVETMEQYAHSAITAERRNLERRLVILNTLGNNIPFIGLLGTVLGIMQAFGDLAELGADAGPSVVMAGISAALIATAAGLIAAVPTVIFYNGLSKGARNKISEAEEIVSILKAIRLSTPR